MTNHPAANTYSSNANPVINPTIHPVINVSPYFGTPMMAVPSASINSPRTLTEQMTMNSDLKVGQIYFVSVFHFLLRLGLSFRDRLDIPQYFRTIFILKKSKTIKHCVSN